MAKIKLKCFLCMCEAIIESYSYMNNSVQFISFIKLDEYLYFEKKIFKTSLIYFTVAFCDAPVPNDIPSTSQPVNGLSSISESVSGIKFISQPFIDSRYPPGSQIFYVCNDTVASFSSITCGPNGWSDPDPECTGKENILLTYT